MKGAAQVWMECMENFKLDFASTESSIVMHERRASQR
jgi:hypothetical protein